jgi:hypothetical protein
MTSTVHTKIDGVALPTPTQVTTTEYDLDTAATGRPESGYLHRERKRNNLMECQYTWTNLTESQAAIIRAAVEPPQFLLERKFLGQTVQKTMYAGDRKWDEVYNPDNGEVRVDVQIKFSEY